MKRIWWVLCIVIFAAIVVLFAAVTLRPGDYVQGRIEVSHSFGGLNSNGTVELYALKWLVTDDAVYNLEFLPNCRLVGIRGGESINSVAIGGKWFLIENGAIYRAKGDITSGGLISSSHGDRRPYKMQVRYLKFIRSDGGTNK